jgi:putative aminopeptidase FrvX
MRLPRKLCFALVVFSFALLSVASACAQLQDLRWLVETPAVSGHEQVLAEGIRSKLAAFKNVATDEMGNVWVTIGRGAPVRLIVAPIDEPGYVVSQITPEGYLRLQRLPQVPFSRLFDELSAAQPVEVETRAGRWLNGVVAGRSVHLEMGAAESGVTGVDEMYVDVGASSAVGVRLAGIDLLAPVAIDRELYQLGFGELAGATVGDRFATAALLALARELAPARVQGTLVLAFVAQQWTGARGFERLVAKLHPNELIYVGRLIPDYFAGREPARAPASGVLIGVAHPKQPLAGFAAELASLARERKIRIATDFSAPVIPRSYLPSPELPARFVHLGIATAWPSTPAETIQFADLAALVHLLEAHLSLPLSKLSLPAPAALPLPALPARPVAAPGPAAILTALVETYGVSGHEAPVREAIERLLPPWAKPTTDPAGNLVLHIGAASGGPARILFVAHMDEIGFEVKSVAPDGRLVVAWQGGGVADYFVGHPVLVVTAQGLRPGVLELPEGYDRRDFRWPARLASFRVDVGARSPDEVRALGIAVGDSLTVPKRYRHLLGTRAAGRSFDDRVGDTALIAAVWALGLPADQSPSAGANPKLAGRNVTFVWSTGEELGLDGAWAMASRLAGEGRSPAFVAAVDTFVTSDSPLESARFADAQVGRGFVVRAVDNSNIIPLPLVDRVVRLAHVNRIAVQYGVTGGGNDGAAFSRFGSTDVALGWPLRYSHSPGEVADVGDVEALARIVAAMARAW